jgi:CO/xanthine dehydrogenase Mo-binding subunit
MDDLHYPALLREVADGIDWSSQPMDGRMGSGRVRRGKGVAITVKGTVTPSTSTASIKLNEDGSVSLLTSTTEIGQGSRTVLAQIAADAVGVPYEMVRTAYPDTDLTPWDQTTSSSRSTSMMGGAVRKAGEAVRKQVKAFAAAMLEVGAEDLEIGGGEVWVQGVPERRLTLEHVVRHSRSGNILASGTNASEGGLDSETGQGIATSHFTQTACGAEVEVDLETGRVTVVNLVQASYAGVVVHPAFAALQAEGSVTFGIGQALMEEMVLDGGQVANANLGDYLIPSMRDLPSALRVPMLEHPSGEAAVYGLGEGGTPVVPPAIGNAIYAACGVRLDTLPITPERVLRALRAR